MLRLKKRCGKRARRFDRLQLVHGKPHSTTDTQDNLMELSAAGVLPLETISVVACPAGLLHVACRSWSSSNAKQIVEPLLNAPREHWQIASATVSRSAHYRALCFLSSGIALSPDMLALRLQFWRLCAL